MLLDHRDGLQKGGDSGPAVVSEKPGESLLVKALKYDGLEMPPKGKLPANVVADFEHWIKLGAPDPRERMATAASPKLDFAEASKLWSFQPPKLTPSSTDCSIRLTMANGWDGTGWMWPATHFTSGRL